MGEAKENQSKDVRPVRMQGKDVRDRQLTKKFKVGLK